MNDAELLRRYAEEASQDAFAELVRLRIGLVYAAALRRSSGDPHRAQEVTQAVFTGLAQKSASLCRHRADWMALYRHPIFRRQDRPVRAAAAGPGPGGLYHAGEYDFTRARNSRGTPSSTA
jgi:hypothetical protein